MQKIRLVQANADVGVLEEATSAELTVRLSDGQHVLVSRDELEPLADGTLQLKTPLDRLRRVPDERVRPVRAAATVPVHGDSGRITEDQLLTIPRVEEQLHIEKVPRVQGKVRVRVVPSEHEQTVSASVTDVHAEVKRVPINRIVDRAPPTREEGGVVIVSVVEEVLVVEKRLMLREEVHITRAESTRMEEHRVMLRREHVEVEREDDD